MKVPASLADIGTRGADGRTRSARPAALGGRRRPRSSCSIRPSSTSAPGGASTRASTCCPRWPPSSSRSNGRNGLAAAALALALMTKPQALPFLLPFAAWFWAPRRAGAEIVRTAAIGLAVIVVVWLPFIAAGGPADYLQQPGRLPERDLPDPVAPGVEHLVAGPGSRRSAASSRPTTGRGPRADHVPPHRLRHHRPAVARRRRADPARPAAADAHPGPRRVDARSGSAS